VKFGGSPIAILVQPDLQLVISNLKVFHAVYFATLIAHVPLVARLPFQLLVANAFYFVMHFTGLKFMQYLLKYGKSKFVK